MAIRSQYIPISSTPTVDESNYLVTDFRKILTDRDIQGYEYQITQLWRVGRAIEEALADGFSDRIAPVQTYYLEAVRWLKGQSQTNSWIQLAPLNLDADSVSLRGQLDQFFQSWFSNFLNDFFNRPILTSYYFMNSKLEQRQLTKTQLDTLDKKAAELVSDLTKEGEKEVDRIRQAASLEAWQTYYDSLIADPYLEGEEK